MEEAYFIVVTVIFALFVLWTVWWVMKQVAEPLRPKNVDQMTEHDLSDDQRMMIRKFCTERRAQRLLEESRK